MKQEGDTKHGYERTGDRAFGCGDQGGKRCVIAEKANQGHRCTGRLVSEADQGRNLAGLRADVCQASWLPGRLLVRLSHLFIR
ncbi:MAG: hypothetical protein GX112_03470 [Clostridiaceae bacterium]|nr:hypothetical protein [Clostridiaceae bacterium]